MQYLSEIVRIDKMPEYFDAVCLCLSCEKREKKIGQIVCDYCHKHIDDPDFHDK